MRRALLAMVFSTAAMLVGCVAPAAGVDGGLDAGEVDAGALRPPECAELTLAELRSSSATRESYERQPDLQTSGQLLGDASRGDFFRFFVDAAQAEGRVDLVRPTNLRTCSNCGAVYVDLSTASLGSADKRFAAVSGSLVLDGRMTPYQGKGTLSNVRFDEVVADGASNLSFVPSGACVWLRSISFDTRREGGCVPFATTSPCPTGQQCVPTNAIGSDGQCTAFGAKAEGEGCTKAANLVADAGTTQVWDSDCAPGLRCIKLDGAPTSTCRAFCDVRSTQPGCPAGTRCGGGYNLCLTAAELTNSGFVTAPVGTACAPGAKAGAYCGGQGLPGVCTRLVSYGDDGGVPLEQVCKAYTGAVSECVGPGLAAGYIAYKGGIDLSTGFCYPRDPRDGGF